MTRQQPALMIREGPLQSQLQFRLPFAQARAGVIGHPARIALILNQASQHLSSRQPEQIRGHRRDLDIATLTYLFGTVLDPIDLLQQMHSPAQQFAYLANLLRRHEAAAQLMILQQSRNALAIERIALLSL